MEADCLGPVGARDLQVLNRSARKASQIPPPIFGRNKQIDGTNQVAYFAALVRLFNARPGIIKFLPEIFRFISQNCGLREKIKDGTVRACDWRIKFPAGKDADAARAHSL